MESQSIFCSKNFTHEMLFFLRVCCASDGNDSLVLLCIDLSVVLDVHNLSKELSVVWFWHMCMHCVWCVWAYYVTVRLTKCITERM